MEGWWNVRCTVWASVRARARLGVTFVSLLFHWVGEATLQPLPALC